MSSRGSESEGLAYGAIDACQRTATQLDALSQRATRANAQYKCVLVEASLTQANRVLDE